MRGAPKHGSPLEAWSSREIVNALAREERRALAAVERVGAQLAALAERLAETFDSGGRLVYVGAGTSGRLGMLDAVELPPTFGVSPRLASAILAGGKRALTRAVEGAEDDEADATREIRRARISRRDFVLGISASGTTPFVLAALRAARSRGAFTVLLCCQKPRTTAPAAKVVLLATGAELIPGSTRLKAGTATKLALNALSTTAMVRFGRVHQGQMVDLLPTNRKLKLRALEMVKSMSGLSERDSRALLARAKGSPRLALAMHHTGMGVSAAQRALNTHGISQLEKVSRRRGRATLEKS